ncbi:hypothetical protein Nepgr_016754 [Nepenthes gracilis]|uniref:Uncharacterized protein n=1 Tax=Nepenthes gracilis TaxID=150966 RepID=A0AAD3SN82_NEPGR|nr:hypothetical protein Nepgr_016754 [Nepenthes gracilis]
MKDVEYEGERHVGPFVLDVPVNRPSPSKRRPLLISWERKQSKKRRVKCPHDPSYSCICVCIKEFFRLLSLMIFHEEEAISEQIFGSDI